MSVATGGWEDRGNGIYESTQKWNTLKTRNTPGGGGQITIKKDIRVKVNNKTGAIDFYEASGGGDKLFQSYSPEQDKWIITDQSVYDKIVDEIGTDELQKRQAENKAKVVENVINTTSTDEDKGRIKATDGYSGSPIDVSPENVPVVQSTANVLSRKDERERNKPDRVVGAEGASYPLNMGTMDRIRFRALKIIKEQYSSQFKRETSFPDNAGAGGFFGSFRPSENTYEPVDGPVYIGIQAPISDQNSVGWGNGNMSAIDAYLYTKALQFIGTNDFAASLERAGKEIYGITKQSNEEILRLIAGMAAGMNDILPRVSAQILNPNLELLFQGPQLRPFNFTFNLIAYDADESEKIKKIIKFFKQNMAVQKTDNYLFLHAPHVFEIRYMNGEKIGEDHKSINLITGDSKDTKKACALTNCSVDYTPLGSYMTFQDTQKSMVQYTLNLQFQELTPVYDEDYKSSNSIGY